MANPRAIVNRRKAVRNIRKITRTMQLIATARFHAASNRSLATKPYTEKLAEILATLSSATADVEHPLMKAKEGATKSVLVVLTSMRGLCGGYNTNVLRTALAQLNEFEGRSVPTETIMVGKKGIAYFRFLRRAMAQQVTNLGDAPRFDQVSAIADKMMSLFIAGDIAEVRVAYMRFHSLSRQKPEVLQLLPVAMSDGSDAATKADGEAKAGAPAIQREFEFSPSAKELLDELLPAAVRMRLYQCFTDAAVSEHVARMVAMKAATDSAGDTITLLTRSYNRARQSQITLELLDILGGVNALA